MVKIRNLKESNKTEYGKIKKDEIAKTKKYIAVIYTSIKVDINVINSNKKFRNKSNNSYKSASSESFEGKEETNFRIKRSRKNK